MWPESRPFPGVPTDGSTGPNCWDRFVPREPFPTRGLLKHRFVSGPFGGDKNCSINVPEWTQYNQKLINDEQTASPPTLMQVYQKKQEGFEFSLVLQSAAFVLGHANDGGLTFLTCHSHTARQSKRCRKAFKMRPNTYLCGLGTLVQINLCSSQ